MHNGRTADPLDPYAKKLSALNKKRGKQDTDHELIGEVEFEAALYWSDEIGLYIPRDGLQRMLFDGSKKLKMGPQMHAVSVAEEYGAALVTPNHKSLDALKKDKTLYFRKVVTVQNSKIVRTRPMFPTGWRIDFKVELDIEGMNRDEFSSILHLCGQRIGIGSWRPGSPKQGSFGKFIVESIKEVKP